MGESNSVRWTQSRTTPCTNNWSTCWSRDNHWMGCTGCHRKRRIQRSDQRCAAVWGLCCKSMNRRPWLQSYLGEYQHPIRRLHAGLRAAWKQARWLPRQGASSEPWYQKWIVPSECQPRTCAMIWQSGRRHTCSTREWSTTPPWPRAITKNSSN